MYIFSIHTLVYTSTQIKCIKKKNKKLVYSWKLWIFHGVYIRKRVVIIKRAFSILFNFTLWLLYNKKKYTYIIRTFSSLQWANIILIHTFSFLLRVNEFFFFFFSFNKHYFTVTRFIIHHRKITHTFSFFLVLLFTSINRSKKVQEMYIHICITLWISSRKK